MGSYRVNYDFDGPAPAARMKRLLDAGLSEKAAELVARHPNGGPVVLAPGVVISLFALRADGTSVLTPEAEAAS